MCTWNYVFLLLFKDVLQNACIIKCQLRECLWNNYEFVGNNVDEVTSAYLCIPLESLIKTMENVIVQYHPSSHISNLSFPKEEQ
jgi:hypothetical protein